jgi:hypothetical protein
LSFAVSNDKATLAFSFTAVNLPNSNVDSISLEAFLSRDFGRGGSFERRWAALFYA